MSKYLGFTFRYWLIMFACSFPLSLFGGYCFWGIYSYERGDKDLYEIKLQLAASSKSPKEIAEHISWAILHLEANYFKEKNVEYSDREQTLVLKNWLNNLKVLHKKLLSDTTSEKEKLLQVHQILYKEIPGQECPEKHILANPRGVEQRYPFHSWQYSLSAMTTSFFGGFSILAFLAGKKAQAASKL